ncbi:MAG: transcription-repair coupling factor [Planctomycetes bacterium]|jgi:transcription-repair coupling factor (superfamily II helicase)|nr:transcription-repair coupling factor [Planctomycetota bacterium]
MDLAGDKVVAQVVSRLRQAAPGPVHVEGTWGSFARLLTAHVARTLHRPILHVCSHIDDADRAFDDLKTFGAAGVELLPAWEGEEELADATDETRAQRLRIVSLLSDPGAGDHTDLVVVAPVQALCQPIPKPAALRASSLELRLNQTLNPEAVVEWLVNNSFERVDSIDLPGQFARRGGIIDIYAPLAGSSTGVPPASGMGVSPMILDHGQDARATSPRAQACRIDFFGDTIESIREINLDTQRSTHEMGGVVILAAASQAVIEQRELFTNILPPGTIVVVEEPAEVEEVAGVFLARTENAGRLYPWTEIHASAARFTQLHICRFATGATDGFLKLDVRSIQQFERKATSLWAGHKAALEDLLEKTKQGSRVLLYCESPAEVQRVTEIVKEIGGDPPHDFQRPLGYVHQGFVIESLRTIVVSHHELFGQYALRRRERPARATAPVDTLADLQPGEYVVHVSYGVGKYLGTETIEEKGGKAEYLTIEYADNVKIQVSVQNIALIQKYIGTSPRRPTLSKVGSKRWQKQKEKVAESVRDLAAEMLAVQAKRQAIGGIAYGEDSSWQMEFEESFPYQETPDQIGAIREIKADMQEPVAMDRLLCGDVGYGKTELAMRAAFKAVENGKQVAVLVPTTVLSVQHARTFAERFADFPVTIEAINRFKTGRQARDILKRTREGNVDVLIGTHRLLSGDVAFKDLGLLIIDEEQRFGVEHKERLKRMRVNVDILTMTATPIPRTLHMALLGLRDISSLATAPLDRRSIVTQVNVYSQDLIRKAITHELNRQGQVFFLHNRVQSIEKKAWELQKLAPDARFGIAHGQMSKRELEDAMIQFVLGRIDVLVCTTIIESGLDIPNANTILINDADRFGLAELHQLRGRVGRYKHRAHAYMLLPNTRPISPIAAKRLKAIEEYSHLGAGFRIALRDLEIRGAGNILGPEQSGHIQMVGYQMYCEMLANAVHEMKHEKVEPLPTTMIDLSAPTYIPKNYIPIDRHRMDAYRKIAVARTPADLQQIEAELADVYGPLPEEVKLLLDIGELRIAASRHGIRAIAAQPPEPGYFPGTMKPTGDLIFTFKQDPGPAAKTLFAKVRGEVRIPDPKTVRLRLAASYFEPRTLIGLLRKIFTEGRK